MFATVPGEAPLVVRSSRSTRVLYGVLLGAALLLVVLAVAVGMLAIWLDAPLMLIVLPPLAVQIGFTTLIVREYQGLLGPQLAADHTGVWVRTGLGRRPEAVHLPWAEIDGIDTVRAGPVVRVLSRHGEALFGRRPHWRVRSLRKRFGTAFVVDGKRSAEHPELIAHRLRQLAGWAAPR
jgi:hypothetical protein